MPIKPDPTKRSTPSLGNRAEDLCCINIEFTTLILPITKGLKVMELLRGARVCERSYGQDRQYFMRDAVELEYYSIKPSQLSERKPSRVSTAPSADATGDQP